MVPNYRTNHSFSDLTKSRHPVAPITISAGFPPDQELFDEDESMKFSLSRHRAGIAFTAQPRTFLRANTYRKCVRSLTVTALFTGAITTGVFLGCRGNYGDGTPGGSVGGGGQVTDFLTTGRTASFFQAIQVDPRSEDTAGPQFVTSADIDGDGLMDLVSAWNQSQPVQIHFQRRNSAGVISFETVTLAGNTPVVRVAGLEVADFDLDGAPDIAVLIKVTGLNETGITCFGGATGGSGEGTQGLIIVYLAPANPAQTNQALAWLETPVESSRVLGATTGDFAGRPEEEGYSSMVVGDLDEDGDSDFVVALNDACNGSDDLPDPKVVTFTNQGFGAVRDGTWSAKAIPDPFDKGSRIKNVALGDVDNDGDLDIFATYPEAASLNVRWYRNPVIDIPDDYHFTSTEWRTGMVGQIATQADVIKVGDVDGDGLLDVVVRSSGGKVIQWLKGPGFQTTTDPVRNLPWRVYTLAEYSERTPEGLAIGDINMDGQLEVIASAAGGLAYFDASGSVFDQWTERLIVDDEPPGSPGNSPATTDPQVEPLEVAGTTFINSIHIVDLDNDGFNDIVATFDRSGLSGLSNDALVWFRSTLP